MAHLTSFASDILEDAMILAQTKAINSFSYRDCVNTLTELWGHCYERLAEIDPGYYSKAVLLTQKATKLPPYVKSSIKIYSAISPVNYNRVVYKKAGSNDMMAPRTYHISGMDLWCADAGYKQVWLEYVPEPPFLTFTKNNRDPKILREEQLPPSPSPGPKRYGQFYLSETVTAGKRMFNLVSYRKGADGNPLYINDISGILIEAYDDRDLVNYFVDYPYLFVSYKMRDVPNMYVSYIMKDLQTGAPSIVKYNPFDYTGRESNVQFLSAKYSDYTGMGVVIKDWDVVDTSPKDMYKELGWTHDTVVDYPDRVLYNYMVASVARRFAMLNGATIPAVEDAWYLAQNEMARWGSKDKSGWGRIDIVTMPSRGDAL